MPTFFALVGVLGNNDVDVVLLRQKFELLVELSNIHVIVRVIEVDEVVKCVNDDQLDVWVRRQQFFQFIR